jgi:thymidine phosphorylase
VKTDRINHAVGLVLPCKVGDEVQAGDTLGHIHADDPVKLEEARQALLTAVHWSANPVPPLPHLYETVNS